MQDNSFSLDEYYRLANDLFMRGESSQLAKHHLGSVEYLEEIGASETPEAVSVYNEVACWLRGVSRYDEALEYYMRALALMEKCGLSDTDMERRVRLNLATLYRLTGELDKAEESYEQLCSELSMGSDGYAYVSALNNYSLVCQDKGQFDRASELYETILKVLPLCPNVDEHEIATTAVNAAGVRLRAGDFEATERLARDAISLFESAQREDSHLASAWAMLGNALYMQERFEEGAKAFETALDYNYKYYGQNVDYARIANSLARTFEKLGDRIAAAKRQRTALEVLSGLVEPADARVEAYRAYYEVLIREDGGTCE